MKISVPDYLEGFRDVAAKSVEDSMAERREMGLSYPEDFTLGVWFYSEDSYVSAGKGDDGLIMNINCLPSVMNELTEEEHDAAYKVFRYFNAARAIFPKIDERRIISLAEDPENFFGARERDVDIEVIRGILDGRNVSYEKYKSFLLDRAPSVRELLKTLIPKVSSLVYARPEAIRHDMDHLDLYASPLYHSNESLYREASTIPLMLAQKSASPETCADLSRKAVDFMSNLTPLMEIRALFFSHVPVGEWKTQNYETLKKKVQGHFLYGYLEQDMSQQALEMLAGQNMMSGGIDNHTFRYLVDISRMQFGSWPGNEHTHASENVDYGAAKDILYRELPEWKMKLYDTAKRVVEAVGDAYRDDPGRLSRANNAGSLDEYLELCAG